MKKNLKVISWNINSIRIRLEQLKKIVEGLDPDIICLQETKCENDKFPLAAVQDLGYKYVAHRGQASYNGVAIISKVKAENIKKGFYFHTKSDQDIEPFQGQKRLMCFHHKSSCARFSNCKFDVEFYSYLFIIFK